LTVSAPLPRLVGATVAASQTDDHVVVFFAVSGGGGGGGNEVDSGASFAVVDVSAAEVSIISAAVRFESCFNAQHKAVNTFYGELFIKSIRVETGVSNLQI